MEVSKTPASTVRWVGWTLWDSSHLEVTPNAMIRLQVSDWHLRETTRELELYFSDCKSLQQPRSRPSRCRGPRCAFLARGHSPRHSNLSSRANVSWLKTLTETHGFFTKTEVKAKSKIRGNLGYNCFSQGIAKHVTARFFTLPTLGSWGLEEFFWFFFFFFSRTWIFLLTNITCLWRTFRKHRKGPENLRRKHKPTILNLLIQSRVYSTFILLF